MSKWGTPCAPGIRRAAGRISRISHYLSLASATGFAALSALIAVAVAGCGNSGPSLPQASIATTLAAGSAALRQRDYWAAEQLFEQVIKRDPRQVAGYYDLGLVYQDQHHYRDALRVYAKAQALDENFVPVIYNRAVLYSDTNPQLAMFLYRRVIVLQPDSPTALLNLGLLEGSFGPHLRPQAEKDLARAVQLMPSLASRIPSALRSGLSAAGQSTSSRSQNPSPSPSPAQS
jgi:tetratricopeptide (TPR) repeat protein